MAESATERPSQSRKTTKGEGGMSWGEKMKILS